MATTVVVEEADLDNGIVMIYKRYGPRVRMAYDPTHIDKPTALQLLRTHVGAVTELRHGA